MIARTTSRDATSLGGSVNTTLNGSDPWLFVADTVAASSIAVGQDMDHVGYASGWQHGTIGITCEDGIFYLSYGEYKVYCEDVFSAYVLGGDSGGPVFQFDSYQGVALAGIENAKECVHYTCHSSPDEGNATMFSPWSAVTNDLGNLNPLIGTTVSTPILTGVDSSGFAKISWSAVSTTNTTATTQYHLYQWTWDASTSTYTEDGAYKGSITSLSYKDPSAPWSITAVSGGTQPDRCTYSSIGLAITAYNQGVKAATAIVWFQGPSNGPGGLSC